MWDFFESFMGLMVAIIASIFTAAMVALMIAFCISVYNAPEECKLKFGAAHRWTFNSGCTVVMDGYMIEEKYIRYQVDDNGKITLRYVPQLDLTIKNK